MRRATMTAFVAAVFLAAPSLLQAQFSLPWDEAPKVSAANMVAAQELMKLLKMSDQFKAAMPDIILDVKMNWPDGTYPPLDGAMDALVNDAANSHLQDHLQTASDWMAANYGATFTLDELHQLIAFYQSPVGLKLIANQEFLAKNRMDYDSVAFKKAIDGDIDKRVKEWQREHRR